MPLEQACDPEELCEPWSESTAVNILVTCDDIKFQLKMSDENGQTSQVIFIPACTKVALE